MHQKHCGNHSPEKPFLHRSTNTIQSMKLRQSGEESEQQSEGSVQLTKCKSVTGTKRPSSYLKHSKTYIYTSWRSGTPEGLGTSSLIWELWLRGERVGDPVPGGAHSQPTDSAGRWDDWHVVGPMSMVMVWSINIALTFWLIRSQYVTKHLCTLTWKFVQRTGQCVYIVDIDFIVLFIIFVLVCPSPDACYLKLCLPSYIIFLNCKKSIFNSIVFYDNIWWPLIDMGLKIICLKPIFNNI